VFYNTSCILHAIVMVWLLPRGGGAAGDQVFNDYGY